MGLLVLGLVAMACPADGLSLFNSVFRPSGGDSAERICPKLDKPAFTPELAAADLCLG